MKKLILGLAAAVGLAGCVGQDYPDNVSDSCWPSQYDNWAFITVDEPEAGQTVTSPFIISGCSRTFESSIVYQIYTFDRELLAMGISSGGGVDGQDTFEIEIDVSVEHPTMIYIRVYETNPADISEQQFVVPSTKFPVLLLPSTHIQ